MKSLALYTVGFLAVAAPLSMRSCITTIRVADGLITPVFATANPLSDDGLYVVELLGRIKHLDLTTGKTTVFLDVRNRIALGGERGLLGLAFHPDFEQNGLFYVSLTAKPDGASQVLEFQAVGNDARTGDPNSARLLIEIPQPQSNHNGGWIGFGPDNLLYVAIGDGGGANDEGEGHTAETGNSQDIEDNLLGKMLRIDPTTDDFPADEMRNYGIPADNPFVGITGDDEIWSYGLRNPWRCGFDRETGDLWIGDVGQDDREEIDFEPVGSMGGANYGWRLREGTIQTPAQGIGGPPPADNVEPIYDYEHGNGQFEGNAVTGGYVYRGPIAELQGQYFFADFTNDKVWSFTRSNGSFENLTDWTRQFQPDAGTLDSITSFGEDRVGNLFIVGIDGEIFQVVEMSVGTAAALQTANVLHTLLGDFLPFRGESSSF